MRIIIGHTNMDLDCLGSLSLARVLFPGFKAVRSKLIHPVARTLYNLYADRLDMASLEELSGKAIEAMIVVDTRSTARIKEFLQCIDPLPPIEVWDHHPADSSDIPGAIMHEAEVGANTTLLAREAMSRGLRIAPEEATIALTGIYADTGSFTHENVRQVDFEAAAWLLRQGASLALVKSFLQSLKEESQITLFHELLNRLTYQTVHGHMVITAYMEMERQVGGLAAVVEKVQEVESPDALFAVFSFVRQNETLVIGRSQERRIDVAAILAPFGGGGHRQAASALCKGKTGRGTFHALQACLKTMLAEAATAGTLMEREFAALNLCMSLSDASLFLERHDRTGAPVVDERSRLCGYLGLRDVAKARRAGQLGAPVSSHMVRKVVSGTPAMTLREIEALFFSHTIYDIPIVEQGKIVGVLTRDAYLKARAER